MARIKNFKVTPESLIQDKIITKLQGLKWSVKATHGNLYSWGFPDLYCCHLRYGTRWVEVKDPNRRGDIFTNAQHDYFRELQLHGVGVWILTGDSDSEVEKLFKAPNWWHYLQIMQ